MSHELLINVKTGLSTMARRQGTDTAWHETDTFKPGIFLPSDSIEEKCIKASFDFDLIKYPVQSVLPEGIIDLPDNAAIFRRDWDGSNPRPLAVKSKIYKPVQPKRMMQFFDEELAKYGFDLNTAGVLNDGLGYWACADIAADRYIGDKDKIGLYVVLHTSFRSASKYYFTSVRAVCANTIALGENSAGSIFKQSHRGEFDPEQASLDLNLVEAVKAYNDLVDGAKELSTIHPKKTDAMKYLVSIWGDIKKEADEQDKTASRHISACWDLYQGKGQGATLDGAKDTAWGLVNAVTEYVDHHQRAHTPENRFNRAWFGPGSASKRAAYELALELGRGSEWLDATEKYNQEIQFRRNNPYAPELQAKPTAEIDGESLFASLLN